MKSNNIRKIRLLQGLTLEEVAEKVGVSAGQVSRWETKDVDIPKSRLTTLAGILNCSIDDLLKPLQADNPSAWMSGLPPIPRQHLDEANQKDSAFQELIPVYSTRSDETEAYYGKVIEKLVLSEKPFAYSSRLDRFSSRTDIYGLYVRGQSMEPVYQEGDLVLAGEAPPPRNGDDVIIHLKPLNEGNSAKSNEVIFKRLVKRTPEFVEVEQFNPDLVIRVPTDRIQHIHRCLRLSDALTLHIL